MTLRRTALGMPLIDGQEAAGDTDERLSEISRIATDLILGLNESVLKLNTALLDGSPAEAGLVAEVMAAVDTAVQVSDARIGDILEDPATVSGALLAGKADLSTVKTDIGLDKVNNTSDADKPISTAQRAAFPTVIAVSGALGNGMADAFPAIQAALDQAAAAGTPYRVYITDGVYLLTSGGTLTIGSNTHLDLAPNAILRRNSSTSCMLMNKSDGVTGGYGAAKNITVSGGEFDSNTGAFPDVVTNVSFGHATNITVRNVRFRNNTTGWHLLELNACKGSRVLDCTFSEHTNSKQELTEMLQLDLALDSAVFPWFGPYDKTPCDDIRIEGNTFTDGTVTAIGSHSRATGFSHKNIRIINNTFRLPATGYAIKTLNYDDLLIAKNTIIGGERSIVVNGTSGVGCKNATVIGNQITSPQRHAVGFDYTTGIVCKDNIITGAGSSPTATGVGVYLYFSKDAIVQGNDISGGDAAAVNHGDIAIGGTNVATNPVGTSDVIATGNICDTVMVAGDSARVLVSQNIIKGSVKLWGTAPATYQRQANFIAGVWTP
ncbi:right-handed parallel beta-helix repeat-containing protein [Arthrobacter pityocampae]|uniref:right-handed parallel beta-helix repeat-containing protein n=1 Tax=Arthrobacter pityocampae TaxID=547334 RepID=UPI0037362B37